MPYDVAARKRRSAKHNRKLAKALFRFFLCLGCLSFPVSIILMHGVENSLDDHPHWINNSKEKNITSLYGSETRTIDLTDLKLIEQKYSNNELLHDKYRLVQALESQNIDISEVSKDTWSLVPTWTQITELYGSKPVVIGLEQCHAFRDAVPNKNDRMIAPAGLFNTGTNLIANLLEHNCHIPGRTNRRKRRNASGVTWQTPWGKHSPPEFRNKTVEDPFFQAMNKDHILPVVAVREPFEWMISTCHNNYVLRWPHRRRCPNLIHPNGTLIEVYNQYFHGAIRRYHKSLAHFWNDWNRQYTENPGFPRLMVRHKDLIFFPKETIQIVCECAGGELIDEKNFTYIINAAKGNRKGAKPFDGLVGNWVKYGKKFDFSQINQEDMEVAKNVLDTKIMKMFGFKW